MAELAKSSSDSIQPSSLVISFVHSQKGKLMIIFLNWIEQQKPLNIGYVHLKDAHQKFTQP